MTNIAPLMSSKREDWNTPGEVLERLFEFGEIWLDPCSNKGSQVKSEYRWSERALERDWDQGGLVYCNPPYGRQIGGWITKMADEAFQGCEIIALVPARPDTQWFGRIWKSAKAVCFWRGRLTFEGAKHPAPFPSALIYWGDRKHRFANVFTDNGHVVFP